MSRGLSDYPLSVFRTALGSTVGRLLAFYLAVGVGCAVCLVLLGLAKHGVDLRGVSPLAVPFIAVLSIPISPSGLLLGLTQGWGFIALVALGAIFVYFFYQESPAAATLPLAVLIAWLETLRALAHEEGFEHALEAPFLVALVAWGAAAALYAVYLVRSRTRAEPTRAPGG